MDCLGGWKRLDHNGKTHEDIFPTNSLSNTTLTASSKEPTVGLIKNLWVLFLAPTADLFFQCSLQVRRIMHFNHQPPSKAMIYQYALFFGHRGPFNYIGANQFRRKARLE